MSHIREVIRFRKIAKKKLWVEWSMLNGESVNESELNNKKLNTVKC